MYPLSQPWEEVFKELQNKVEEERKIWSLKLRAKIDELKQFKQEMLAISNSSSDFMKLREERLAEVEKRLEEEQQYLQKQETEKRNADDMLREAQKKLSQMEKENDYFRQQIVEKTKEINDLKRTVGTAGAGRNLKPDEKIKVLENELQETENFYKRVAERIDKIIKL
jgi:hypothetical protein